MKEKMTTKFTVKKEKDLKDTEFTLSGVDVKKIDNDYKLESISTVKKSKPEVQPKDITPIDKLLSIATIQPLTTLIPREKIKVQKYLSLVCNNMNKDILHEHISVRCFHCHRFFTTSPLIVPITYCEKKSIHVFHGDAIVCSFNCMVSWIEDNSHNKLYHNSITYMLKLYKCIFGEYPSKNILRAPPFFVLQEYGGALTIEEYVKLLQTVEIIDSKQIYMVPVSRILNIGQ
jgi:hypothetical protein